MKWFKHDTDASSDAKIKKLLIRYGAVGYAIYFHCLELIAGSISENNITFELEHDAEIIADNLKIKGTADKSGVEIVNEIMMYIIQLGLFECHNDHIFCFKLLKRLDSSMTSNPNMRKLITEAKENHDGVMTQSCKNRKEENRKEENRKEKEYCSELSSEISGTPFIDLPMVGSVSSPLKTFTVTEEMVKEYQEVYTNVDVKAELKKMKLWLDANPTKRKKNVKAFIARWLAKAQDRPKPPRKLTYEEILAEEKARLGEE